MPVLKHAKKKLRQDKVRTARNKKVKDLYKKLIKEARAKKTAESLSKAFSSIDKAAKHYILHKNTAARMKASLSRVIDGKVSTTAAPVKKVAKKVEKKVEETVVKVEKAAKKTVKKATAKKATPKKK